MTPRILIVLCLTLPVLTVSGQRVESSRINALFSDFTESTPGAAVAVVQGGEVVFRSGFGMADLEHHIPITPETVFDIASVSKQFAGMAVAMLVEEGRLDLDSEVREHLPELPDFGYSLTVRHLVHHVSGIRDWPATLAAGGWRMDDVISFDQILRMAWAQKELNFQPGAEYSYSNTGYNLLAEIVARTTGMSFRAWTDQQIFQPLEMQASHFQDDHTEMVEDRAFGYGRSGRQYRTQFNGLTALGSSSLFSSVDDLAKWLKNFDSQAVGGESVYDRTRTRGILNNDQEIAYAYGLSGGNYKGLSTWTHSGSWAGFRSYLVHFPEQDFGVVILANSGGYTPARDAYAIADLYLADEFSIGSSTSETEEVSVARTLLDEYAGTYRLGAGWYVTISRAGSGLEVQATNENAFPMTARSETEFWVEAYGAAMRFQRDENGAVSQLGYRTISAPRVQPVDLNGIDLSSFTGIFESDELDTRYTIVLQDGALIAKHQRHGDISLTVGGPDEFSGNRWFFNPVTFVRDDQGRVFEMLVGRGRARNLRFRKAGD